MRTSPSPSHALAVQTHQSPMEQVLHRASVKRANQRDTDLIVRETFYGIFFLGNEGEFLTGKLDLHHTTAGKLAT